MSEREEEIKLAILDYVKNNQYVGDDYKSIEVPLTQTKVMNAVMSEIGGSTNTYKKLFEELFDNEKDARLTRINIRKKIWILQISSKQNQISDFKERIKHVDNLLDLLEKHPAHGDCADIIEGSNIPKLDKYHHNQMLFHGEAVTEFHTYETPMGLPEHRKCFQARYDILKNLPLFLVHFINLPQLNFSESTKKYARDMINPIVTKCVDMLQSDYSISPYYTDAYAKDFSDSCKESGLGERKVDGVFLCKAFPMNDIQAEFLKILGRYYFMMSYGFGEDVMRIDSSEQQKTITKFVSVFFPQSTIKPDEIDERLDDDIVIENYMHRDKLRITPYEMQRLDEIGGQALGGKMSIRYEYYGQNDPFVVADYYLRWLYMADIFSSIEKKIVKQSFDDSEHYEDDSKTREEHDVYETFTRPFKKEIHGKLKKVGKNTAILILSESYSHMERYAETWTRLMIEESTNAPYNSEAYDFM